MIVVTGGTGLVGAHLLYELLCAGATTIRALYRKSKNTSLLEKIFQTYNPNALPLIQKIEWVQADILDVPALERALQGVDFLYHCAGMVSFDDSDAQLHSLIAFVLISLGLGKYIFMLISPYFL